MAHVPIVVPAAVPIRASRSPTADTRVGRAAMTAVPGKSTKDAADAGIRAPMAAEPTARDRVEVHAAAADCTPGPAAATAATAARAASASGR